jgi:hypothetical protein
MKIDLRPARWSAALLGITGLAYAMVYAQRKSKAKQESRFGSRLIERYNHEQGV